MLKCIISALVFISGLSALVLYALSREPQSIVYQEYPTRKCLMVDIVKNNAYERISCADFDFTQPYVTEWGGSK